MYMLFIGLVASTLIATVQSECANACNGHGKCTSYDMCICNRNWQGNDCSERICQFGLAHVDTPKGDLDASGSISGPNQGVIDNSFTYPYGTTEQYPQMEDSDLNPLTDSGHYYMECSNKGTCDRATGDCICRDGYDGVACQRASCPGYPASCSGHGVCKSKKQLADADYGNVYKLWDKDVTMGCECDKGYFGPDCSERSCKYGVDPLYLDDSATIKYSIYDFATLIAGTQATKQITFTDGFAQPGKGYWAIRFFDASGEDWVTGPIPAGATCAQVIAALEALPNDVIPPGFTECSETMRYNTPEHRWQSYDQASVVPQIQWVLGDNGANSAQAPQQDCNQICQAIGASCSNSGPWWSLAAGMSAAIDISTCNQFDDDVAGNGASGTGIKDAFGNFINTFDLKTCSKVSSTITGATQSTAANAAASTFAPYYLSGTGIVLPSSGSSPTCNVSPLTTANAQRFCPCTGNFYAPTTHPYRISYNLSIWEANFDSNPEMNAANLGADPLPISQFLGSANSVQSQASERTPLSGFIYRVKFYGNPGAFPEPQIELYLDGKRPSLQASTQTTATVSVSTPRVITKVWTDGQQGEFVDHFADHCAGVTVQIGWTTYGLWYLTGLSATEKALLKTCLGSSDFDTSNNRETYNWDYGNKLYPHIIKLVRSVTVYTDGGYYAAIWYKTGTALDNTAAPNTNQGAQGTFMLLNPFNPPDAFASDNYEVYTTKGTLGLTSNASEVTFGFASKSIFITNSSYDTTISAAFDGDISCEIGNNNAYKTKYIFHCLNKTDLFTFLSFESPETNPPYINLYTAKRLYTKNFQYSVGDRFGSSAAALAGGVNGATVGDEMHYMTHVITTDISTNWGVGITSAQSYRVYKFFPAVASDYEYTAQCANRGICDTATGTCKCFPGYTNDDCSVQNSISV